MIPILPLPRAVENISPFFKIVSLCSRRYVGYQVLRICLARLKVSTLLTARSHLKKGSH